ncbi:hypothetical protein [Vibrio algivorus]|uniref:Uncharacterized protein n=1 Tax=Vibrio algivorus TaxID=1667024 RepID=A0A557PC40_9VIBR|nr:hypothetical protein [Vibrio algivorus]TVO38186.1 hypothetical protein FOF44_04920 [Vibrio algivorus]
MTPNFPSFLFLPKKLIIRASKGKSSSIFSHELKQLDLMAGKPEHLIDFGAPIYREIRLFEGKAEPTKKDILSFIGRLSERFHEQLKLFTLPLLFSLRPYTKQRAMTAAYIFLHAKGLTALSNQHQALAKLLISRCEYDLALLKAANKKEWLQWGDLLKTQLLVPESLVDNALGQAPPLKENINLKRWAEENLLLFHTIIACTTFHSLALAERYSTCFHDKEHSLSSDEKTCFSVMANSFQDTNGLDTLPSSHFINLLIKQTGSKNRHQFCHVINKYHSKQSSNSKDYFDAIYKRYSRWRSGENPISQNEIAADLQVFGGELPPLSLYAVNFLTKFAIELRNNSNISNIFELCPPYQRFRDLISMEYKKFT